MSIRNMLAAGALLALSLFAFGAEAQSGPVPNRNQAQVFVSYTQLGRAVDITATTASQDEALGVAGPVLTVYNTGSNWAYVGLTTSPSSVTVANGIPVGPGSCQFLNAQNMTHVQAITATASTTLQVSIGWGNPGPCGGGSGGGSGSSGAVFGPTAVGSAIANPPVILGGSQNGLSGGLVGVWKVDATGLGYVNCANCSGSGASAVDSAAFAAGTSVLAPSGGVFNDSLGALTTGTQGTERLTAFRAQHVNLRNNSGVEIGTSSTPVQVSLANTGANGTALSVTTTNTSYGISGTLPAFAATPTVNIGTAPTITVSGTVAATQSGTWNVTNISGTVSLPTGAATSALQPTNATQGSTTSGQTGHLMQAAAVSASPTYTNGTTNPLTTDLSGGLRVSPTGGAMTVNQPTAANLNATVVGTGTFAVQAAQSGTWTNTVTQNTASLLNATVVGTGTFAVQAAQSGTWNITNISGTVSLPTGASTLAAQNVTRAPVAAGTATANNSDLVGAQFLTTQPTMTNTQQASLLTSARGELLVAPGISGFAVTLSGNSVVVGPTADGTAASTNPVLMAGTVDGTGTGAVAIPKISAGGLVSVDGSTVTQPISAAALPLPTGASTAALQPTNAAQGSTTSGQTGHLEMGAVTTASPTYTTAQTSPLSLDTNGGLRVSPVSQAFWGIGSSAQNSATVVNGHLVLGQFNTSPTTITSGNMSPLQLTSAGALITSGIVTATDGSIATIGTTTDSAWPGTGAGTVVAILKSLVSTASQSITISGSLTNPTSTLTLPATTTAYTAGQLIANSATAGSVITPAFLINTAGGGATISRLRLSTNDTTATAWGSQTVQVDLWTVQPTWTNGDRGTFSPATGTGSHLGTYVCVMSPEFGDGAYSECAISVGNFANVKLASGSSVFWSLKSVSGSGVTGASKVWTVTAELMN